MSKPAYISECGVGEDHTLAEYALPGDATGETLAVRVWPAGAGYGPEAVLVTLAPVSEPVYDAEAGEGGTTTAVFAVPAPDDELALGAGRYDFDLLRTSAEGVKRRTPYGRLIVWEEREGPTRTPRVLVAESGTVEEASVVMGPPGPKGDPGEDGSGGGVSDHGALDGLGDDDHTQYALADGSRGNYAAQTHAASHATGGADPITPASIGASAVGHTHTIANVTGLQAALNGKAAATHEHEAAEISDASATGRAVLTAEDAAAVRELLEVYSETETDGLVADAIAALVDSSPSTLDTLNELAAALGDDPNFAATITGLIGGKLAIAANLADLDDAEEARANLGLGTAAVLDAGVANGAATLDESGVLPAEQLTAHVLTAHSDWVGGATPAAGMAVVVVSLSGLGDVPRFGVRDLTAADLKSGTLAVARGGTGGGDAAAARANLGAIGTASDSPDTITGISGVHTPAEYGLLTPLPGVLYLVEEEEA